MAPGRSGKTQSRPEAVCPAAPCPKGLPGGTDSGLVWAKLSGKPGFGDGFVSILVPGAVLVSPLSSHWLKQQPGLPGPCCSSGVGMRRC